VIRDDYDDDVDNNSNNNTYLLTYLLTPWCRAFFEKLIVTQLVKKYPFLWNPKVHYRAQKARHWTLS
jgi:hypothetical protein